MFVVCCLLSLFAFVGRRLLFGVICCMWLRAVVWCLVLVVRCWLCVVCCCLLYVDWCSVRVACILCFVVCCVLFVVASLFDAS